MRLKCRQSGIAVMMETAIQPPMNLAGLAIAQARASAAACMSQAAREDSGRLRDAPDAISSSVERFACAISSQISAGMLSRWSHERIVVIGRPVSDAMWS